MIYRYFISYAMQGGFGRVENNRTKRIRTLYDIEEIEDEFETKYGYRICIINYKFIGLNFGKSVEK